MATLATLSVKLLLDAANFTKGVATVEKSSRGLGKSLRGIGKKAIGVGKNLSLGVTAPLLAIGGVAAKTAGDFESQMNILEVAARNAGTGLDDLRDASIKVGADTDLVGISASEAADAMTGFYKAGLSTTDIFGDLEGYLQRGESLTGALRASVDLAAASELDLAAASDIVSVMMATFGLSAAEATGIADSFVQAADASVAEVGDLAEALRNVGPVAATFGWSLGETNTALAILSTRGITGAEAGTALKSMMVNLMRPTDEVTGALDELGVSLYDQEGQMLALPDIIGQLGGAMEGLTDEQRNQYVQTLAGSYGMRAMHTLLAEGTPGWQKMEGAIAGAASAQEVADARTQGLNQAIENFKGVLETLMIKVGLPFIENFLTPLVDWLSELLGGILEQPSGWEKWILIIGGALAAIGPVVVILGVLVTGIGLLLSPIGLVVVAIAALGVAWATNFGGIRDKTAAAWAAIQPIFAVLQAWLAENLPKAWEKLKEIAGKVAEFISDFVTGRFQIVADWVQENWPLIQQTIETVLNAIRAVVKSVVTFVSSFWKKHHDKIKSVAMAIWEFITGLIDNNLKAILDIIKAVMKAINGDWRGAWKTVRNTFRNYIKGVLNIGRNLFNKLKTVFLPIIETLKARAITKFKDLKNKILEHIRELPGKLKQAGIDMIQGMINGVGSMAGALESAIRGLISAAIAAVRRALGLGSPSRVFQQFGEMTIAGFVNGIDAGSRDAVGAIRGVMAAVEAAATPVVRVPIRMPSATIPMGGMVSAGVAADRAVAGGTTAGGDTYNLFVTYRNEQDEASLRDTIRALQMAGA